MTRNAPQSTSLAIHSRKGNSPMSANLAIRRPRYYDWISGTADPMVVALLVIAFVVTTPPFIW